MGTTATKPAAPVAAKKAPAQQQPPKAAPSPPTPPPVASPTTPVVVKKRVPVAAANPTDTAILELKLQRERLQKAQVKYSNLADKLKAAAVEAMKAAGTEPEKAKANALLLVKRSRLYEQHIESCSNNLLNVETSLSALEDGLVQAQVMRALEGGARALESINAELARADEVMDTLREAIETSKEIAGILGAPVLGAGDVAADDDELEAELLKMMGAPAAASTATAATPKPKIAVDQVVVPNHALPAVAEQPQQKAAAGDQQGRGELLAA
jgi:hypothetical protein